MIVLVIGIGILVLLYHLNQYLILSVFLFIVIIFIKLQVHIIFFVVVLLTMLQVVELSVNAGIAFSYARWLVSATLSFKPVSFLFLDLIIYYNNRFISKGDN